MRISFIIPVYNASNTIRACLNSIYSLNLNEVDFEVIAIDDCSTDNSIDILKEYQRCHANMILYSLSSNRRPGTAKNIGIERSNGDYIVFVDSDDEVAGGILPAIELAKAKGLEMIAMRVAMLSNNGVTKSEKILSY